MDTNTTKKTGAKARGGLYLLSNRNEEVPLAAGFVAALEAFMATPGDRAAERHFATAFLNAQFFVPAATGVDKSNGTLALQPRLTAVTYLADGERYIPAFTDVATAKAFMMTHATNMNLQLLAMPAAKLMDEVARAEATGILVDPQTHCAPLSLDYWTNITHVVPVSSDEAEEAVLSPLADAAAIQAALTAAVASEPRVVALWLTGVQLPSDDAAVPLVIADYVGTEVDYDTEIAPLLAEATKSVLGEDQDVLTGTLADPLGRRVAETTAAVYTGTHQQEA